MSPRSPKTFHPLLSRRIDKSWSTSSTPIDKHFNLAECVTFSGWLLVIFLSPRILFMVRQGFHNNDDINFLSNVLGALSSYCVVTSDSLSSSLQIDENIISHDFKQKIVTWSAIFGTPKIAKNTHFGCFWGHRKWHLGCPNQNSKTTFQYKYPP